MKTEIYRGYHSANGTPPPTFPLSNTEGSVAREVGATWRIVVRVVKDPPALIAGFLLQSEGGDAIGVDAVEVISHGGDPLRTPAVLHFTLSAQPPVGANWRLQATSGSGSYYYTVVRVPGNETVSMDNIYDLLARGGVGLSRGDDAPGSERGMEIELDGIRVPPDWLARRLLHGQTGIEFNLDPCLTIRNYGLTAVEVNDSVNPSVLLSAGKSLSVGTCPMNAPVSASALLVGTAQARHVIYTGGDESSTPDVELVLNKEIGHPVIVCMLDASGSMKDYRDAIEGQVTKLVALITRGTSGEDVVVKHARVGHVLLHGGITTKYPSFASRLPMLGDYEYGAIDAILGSTRTMLASGEPSGGSPLGALVAAGRALADASAPDDGGLRSQDRAVLMLVTDGYEDNDGDSETDSSTLSAGPNFYSAELLDRTFATWLREKDTLLYVFWCSSHPSWWTEKWYTVTGLAKNLDAMVFDDGHPLTMFIPAV